MDITPMCGSPWLIAACHVLLRLLMPRHSPCALYSLTYYLFSEILVLTRIMQASDLVHCSICVTLFIVPQLKLCYLSVACSQFLACFTVQFSRCSFQPSPRSDRNIRAAALMLRFELESSGGPKWTRTTDLTIISRAL